MGAVVSQQGLRLLVPASGLDDSVKLLLAHRLAIIAPASDTLSARTPHCRSAKHCPLAAAVLIFRSCRCRRSCR